MSHTCVKCSRIGPKEAIYCYNCGFAMNGHGRSAGPVAMGAQQFGNPFVFPTGRTCRSFDELAVACQEDWNSARDLLGQGFFGAFFGGMGRADLARAANEAKKFGDLDRGLDQLLDKLPTEVLQEPKLRVDPLELNLGTIAAGADRELELHLENQGMRLLYGKIKSVETPWLVFGEGKGVDQKLFEFTHEAKIVVRLRGEKLRANNKPLEGKLVLDSNGGEPVTVTIRADVPVKPYPGNNVLAGARSPRQVAEKAKGNPKEAAVLFEKGDVAAWYKSNGWTYPVQGSTAAGIGAVQQYFEALGLTPPPKVEISTRSISLAGNAGDQNVSYTVQVSTQEKRPVYASAQSNQPWLEVGKAKLAGRMAAITVNVASVPDRPGETLTAKLLVQANGNQKFVIPVTLQIGSSLDFGAPTPIVSAPRPAAIATQPMVHVPIPTGEMDFSSPEPLIASRRRSKSGNHWLAAAALALAVLVLVIVDVSGMNKPGDNKEETEEERLAREFKEANKDLDKKTDKDTKPPPIIKKGKTFQEILEGTKPNLRVGFTEDNRYGLSLIGVPDPNNRNDEKRLVFDRNGATNNTIVKINDHEYIFGRRHASRLVETKPRLEVIPRTYWVTKVIYHEFEVTVSQHVILVPGPSGTLDNCLVYYAIENGAKKPTVGVRTLIDTYIGANDGVPFTIPGRPGFMKDAISLSGKQVPDYVEAVENPDSPESQGTIARFGLNLKGLKLPPIDKTEMGSNGKPMVDRLGKPIVHSFPAVEEWDEITKLNICQQPENPQVKWNWGENPDELQPIRGGVKPEGDSCAVLFWDALQMTPNERRNVGFTYGLNKIEVKEGETIEGPPPVGMDPPKPRKVLIGLSTPVVAGIKQEFTVTAYVFGAQPGMKVDLQLPDGVDLVGGNKSQTIQAKDISGPRAVLHWKVKADRFGTYQFKGKTGSAESKPKEVKVTEESIFG